MRIPHFVLVAGSVSAVVIAVVFGIAVILPSSAAAAPSVQDKTQVIQGYYTAVSSQRYEEAYELLTPGFYTSAIALQNSYREVGTVDVDISDIPDSPKAHVRVTLHWRTGGITSVYEGTITLAYAASAQRWLIGHRDLQLVQGPPIDAPQRAPGTRAQPIRFAAAVSTCDVGYTLRGADNSSVMDIHIRNKTDQAWELTIEEGLRLEPSGSSAQTMTVTKEVQVKLEPHEETTIELDVACLDISKPPPSPADTTWTIAESVPLATYITCTNDAINEAQKNDPTHAATLERLRRGLLQMSLWAARGASESDWALFYHKWQHLSEDAAAQMAHDSAPLLKAFVDQCGSLTDNDS